MRTSASVLAFLSCSISLAQTFNEPTFYMWGAYPPGHTPSTPLARKFIQPHLLTNGWDTNKTALAQAMGAEIASEITAGRLTVDTVAVLLQNFGTDSGACDSTQGNNHLEPTWGGLRFFWDEDRIPGVYEWDTEGTSLTRFPDSRNSDGRESDNGGEARAYRHPFILNALPDDGSTVRAPLRAWLKDFLVEMDAEYTRRLSDPLLTDIPHPATYKWYMDIEPYFPKSPTANSIFLLEQLAQRPTYWDNSVLPANPKNYLWAYRKADNSPYTLSELYEEARVARSWPSGWAGAAGLMAQLNYAVPAFQNPGEHADNRDIMTWYSEVLDVTRNYIIDHCFFGVLRERYGPAVACGNYGMFATDGESQYTLYPAPPDGVIIVPERTGWFEDRAWLGTLAASNVDRASFAPSEFLPRFTWNKPSGGPMYYLLDGRRYLEYATPCSGSAHSPVWYPLSRFEMCNVDSISCGDEWCDTTNTNDRLGHKRRDQWAPLVAAQRPLEGFHAASLRLHRFNAESTINSGYPNVVPWMKMVNSKQNGVRPQDPDLPPDTIAVSTPEEARDYLRLCRMKNLKEGLFWTSWYASKQPTLWAEAWPATEEEIERVYANRIVSYTRVQSNVPAGGYLDAGETTAQKKTRLEFTLRNEVTGYDREVDLKAKTISVPGYPTVYYTSLDVNFEYPIENFSGNEFFEIAIECSVTALEAIPPAIASAPVGKVLMWREPNICVGSPSASGQWVEVGTYDFVAPISGDGRIRARVAFRTPRVVGAVYSQCNLGLPHKSRLRLVQQSSASFESRYDLVQLTPILGLEDEPPAEPLMRSDVNHDGFADAVDVEQFLADWIESHPGADFDQDEFVTPDDVDSFVAAFSSGT